MTRTVAATVFALFVLTAAGCAGVQSRTASGNPAATDESETDPGAQHESERVRRLRQTQSYLEYGAGGALLATATLGLLVFGNQPTSFDDGRCITGDPHFGDYGCSSLSTVHGILGVSSAVTYTSAGVMEWTLPPAPEGLSEGPFESVLTPAHVVGMTVTPALGIVGREPEVLGFDSGPGSNAPRTIRTIHASVAVTTVALYITSYFVD